MMLKEQYYKMVSFWRHWRYCNGCKYLSSFKCAKFEHEESMVYGCCCHTRGPKTSNVKVEKFEDKLSVTWPCRKCGTIIWISEHYISDPCPGCAWVWKGSTVIRSITLLASW